MITSENLLILEIYEKKQILALPLIVLMISILIYSGINASCVFNESLFQVLTEATM
jgi:hypothetical protein